MFKIEKDVQMPEYVKNGYKYPFSSLQVGDSFFVPGRTARELSNSSQWHIKKLGWSFRCVTIDGGARCWRTS